MSDAMLLGVLRMPEEMITGSTLSLVQFINRAREAADRIARDADLIDDLTEALQAITDQLERIGDTRPHKDGRYIEDARAALAKSLGAAP